MSEGAGHDALREMLGAYALGHLDGAEADRVRAHLDGCAACRADLQQILPVARRLDAVDPSVFEGPPTPPAWLGEQIRREVERERTARDDDEVGALREARARRRRTLAGRGVVAAAVVLAAVAVGGVVGRSTAPTAAPVPTEPITMSTPGSADISVESAALVAHTWGVELRIEADGFTTGRTFRASFRTEDGELVPAGEFVGVGQQPMVCFLQSSARREDVTEVVVTDERGRTVLASSAL